MKLFSRPMAFSRRPAAFFLLLAIAGQALAQQNIPLSAVEREIADKITAASISESAAALSADEMQGRGTMQPGGEKAANWIADRFQKLGLKPLGDKGSYLQKVKFTEVAATRETVLTVGDETFAHGTDFAVMPMNNGDKNVSGDMAFIGYGIQSRALNRDDVAGINLAGKVLVVLEGPPVNISKEDWKRAKASSAILRSLVFSGAAAIVYIGTGREEQSPDEAVSYMSRRQIVLPDSEGYPAGIPPIVYVSGKAAEKLFAKSGTTLKDALSQADAAGFKPVKLNQKAKLVAKYKTTSGTSSNVVGYIEGSDPILKQEAVLFSAHYDGYGIENGKIYRGAADNALGTAEMVAVAETFARLGQRPKRSMVFLAVTGEEYGLFGSKYWAKKPTWDIKKVAANLNLDGIGTEVYGPVKTMVGYGAEYSSLGKMLGDVAAPLGISVIADPLPEERVFERSDHYSFVKRGVPALMLLGAPTGDKQLWIKRMKDWEKTDYHQPSDTIQPNWAWNGAEAVAEVMAVMGWRVSEATTMPSWLAATRFGKLERGNSKDLPEENEEK